MISVADNFDHKSKKPLDNRITYATLALMKAVTDANIYEGCEAYCAETDKYYMFKSTNTVDADTGKWRERETGGGGHEIVDSDDTALTQRDVLKFGDGFKVSDDDTNEQTVANINNMQSGDMDDIVHDLPPVTPIDLDEIVDPVPMPAIQPVSYSTAEHIVGTWHNGKALYEKTYILDALSGIVDGTQKEFRTETGFSVNDVDEIFVQQSYLKTSTGKSCYQLNDMWLVGTNLRFARCSIETNTSLSPITEVIMVRCNRDSMNTMIPVVTVRYTKP